MSRLWEILLYAPELALIPLAMVASIVGTVGPFLRARMSAWVWRRRAWPKRI